MITDLTCIDLICDAYNGTGSFEQSLMIDQVDIRIKEYPDATVIVFPGSKSIIDWVRDFEADMRLDPDLGPVEWGFQQGIEEIYKAIPPQEPYDKPRYVTGHSLGAARALIYTALCHIDGTPIEKTTIFGSPRPGGAKLKNILNTGVIHSYRNGNDKVCGVPFYIPFFKPYVHPRPLVQVNEAPPADDPWDVFAWHHAELYAAALSKRPSS